MVDIVVQVNRRFIRDTHYQDGQAVSQFISKLMDRYF